MNSMVFILKSCYHYELMVFGRDGYRNIDVCIYKFVFTHLFPHTCIPIHTIHIYKYFIAQPIEKTLEQ